MNQWKLTLTFVVTVSVLGLISCNSDDLLHQSRVDVDSWALSEPQINTQDATFPLSELVRTQKTTLESGDSLQFPDAGQSQVELTSHTICMSGDTKYEHTASAALPEQITILELLPKTTLFSKEGADQKGLICDFEFRATNALGSTHRFFIRSIRIEESKHNDLVIESANEPLKAQELIHKSRLHNYFLELKADYETLTLKCENFEIDFIPTRHMHSVDLAQLKFDSLEHKGTPTDTPVLKPVQMCRLFALAGKRIKAKSEYFQLKLTFTLIQTRISWSPFRFPLSGENFNQTIATGAFKNITGLKQYLEVPDNMDSNLAVTASGGTYNLTLPIPHKYKLNLEAVPIQKIQGVSVYELYPYDQIDFKVLIETQAQLSKNMSVVISPKAQPFITVGQIQFSQDQVLSGKQRIADLPLTLSNSLCLTYKKGSLSWSHGWHKADVCAKK